MKGRFRSLAALLALVALSAYYAESVMASWCLTEAETAVVMESAHPAAHPGMHHGAPRSGTPESERTDRDTPPCPFGMTGAGATCVAVPLPGTSTAVRAEPIVEATLPPLLVQSPDLLLVTGHFRPPRA